MNSLTRREEAPAHAEDRAGTTRAVFWATRASLYLLGLLCALPFLQWRHSYPITSFYSEWLAFVLGCAALVPLVLARYYRCLRVPWIALTPLGFALVLLMHVVLMRSPYPQQALLAVAYLAWAASLILMASIVRREIGLEASAIVLAWFILVSGCISAGAGLLQYYDARGFLESVIATKLGREVYGNLGQPNHFADHIALALASLVLLYSLRRIGVKPAVPACALLLFVLSLSGSRSTWLYLGSLAVLAVLAYRKGNSDSARAAMRFAIALLPGFALAHAVASMPWLAPSHMHTTVLDRMFELAGTSSERLQLWREAGLMFLDNPVTGVGWGQYSWHYFLYGGVLPDVRLTGLYNHAHNLFLHLLAETGLTGTAIVAAGLAVWAWKTWPILERPAAWWLWSGISVLGIHSMLEYPLWNAYFLGVACILFGLGETRDFDLRTTKLLRTAMIAFVGSATVGAATLIYDYYGLESVLHARYIAGDSAALERSHRQMMAARATFFLTPYVELAYARDIALNVGELEQKIAFTSRVMQFAPTGMVAYRLAALHALRGDEREAQALLTKAAAVYPSLLKDFSDEFARVDTGNARARARFLEMLNAQLTAPSSTRGARFGDENRHMSP